MSNELKSLWKTKFPTWFWGRLPFKYRWEFICFHKLREWHDGISFFEFNINLDKYEPLEYIKFKHNPRFIIHLVFLNYTIFELEIYKSEPT